MGKTGGAEDQTSWGRLEKLRIKPVGKTEGAEDQTSWGRPGGAEDQTSNPLFAFPELCCSYHCH